MKIHIISDTHCLHERIQLPPNIDMLIIAGDISNSGSSTTNAIECIDFFKWLSSFEIKNKVFIPGNHDVSIERGILTLEQFSDVTCLIHRSMEVGGLHIFGSPYTPSFGSGWAYNVKRERIANYWEDIPHDSQIVVTHGPPKGILDTTIDRAGKMEFAGDKALKTKVFEINPIIHCFGHIHNCDGVINAGTRTIPDHNTTFVNASCVHDGRFDMGPSSYGVTITL